MAMDVVILLQRAFLNAEGKAGLQTDVRCGKFRNHGHIMLNIALIVKAKKGL